MAKSFLTGVRCPYIRIDESPLLSTDGTNKQYVDQRAVPSGGTTGQVLVKSSNSDWDVQWQNIQSGAGGGTLINIDMGSFVDPNGFVDCGSF